MRFGAAAHVAGLLGFAFGTAWLVHVVVSTAVRELSLDRSATAIGQIAPAFFHSDAQSNTVLLLWAAIVGVAVLAAKADAALTFFNESLAEKLEVRLQLIKDANPDYEAGLVSAGSMTWNDRAAF